MKTVKRVLMLFLALMLVFSVFKVGKVLADNRDFRLSNVSIGEKSSDVTASIVSYDNDDIITNITFHKVNSYVVLNLSIRNDGDDDYTIETITDNNDSDTIVYEYDKHEGEAYKSGDTLEVNLKATYKNGVTDVNKQEEANDFKLILKLYNDEGEQEDEIHVVPITSDPINTYILLATISLISLIIVALSKKKLNKSLVLIILLVPVLTKALIVNLNVNFTNNMQLYDKVLVTLNENGETVSTLVDYDTTYTPSAPEEIPGYDFKGWYVGDTLFDPTKPVTEQVTLTAIYTPREDTAYKVIHKYQSVDGNSYEEVVETFHGKTDTEVTLPFREVNGFNNPTSSKKLLIKGDGTASDEYIYTRVPVNFTLTDSDNDVTTSKPSGTYPYGTQITLTANAKTGYTFSKWSNDITTNPYTITLTENVTISPVYTINSYQLTYTYFDDSENKTVTLPTGGLTEYNSGVNVAGGLSLAGYTFDGWYKDDTKVTSFNMPAADVTLKGRLTANTDTPYKITHKYPNVEGTAYEEVEVTYYGKTDSEVTIPYREVTGFNNPTAKKITITGDVVATDEYIYTRVPISFTLIDPDNDVISSKVTGTYPYGTQVTLTAQNKEGHTFTKWSNDETINPYTITLTENITISPVYTKNNYQLTYAYYNDSVVTSVTLPASSEVEYGSTVGVAGGLTLTGYTFDGWYKDDTKVTSFSMPASAVTLKGRFTANTNTPYIVNHHTEKLDGTYELLNQNIIEQTGITGDIGFANPITLTGYAYDATNTNNVISGTIAPDGSLVLDLYYKLNVYTINLEEEGGNTLVNPTRKHGATLGTLPNATRDYYDFNGWFDAATGGNPYDPTTVVTSNLTYYAQWTSKNLVCVKAQAGTLHEETCQRTGSGTNGTEGCYKNGYRLNGTKGTTTITYGNLSTSTTLNPGDAFNCDINGDGVYDDTNERFYYLRDNGSNAVLIFYTNFQGTNGIGTNGSYHYAEAETMLPTTTQWNNIETLFDGKPARFISQDDIETACNMTLATSGAISDCEFLFENTTFHVEPSNNEYRSGLWIRKANPDDTSGYRIQARSVNYGTVEYTESNNAARPVIEVPKEFLDDSIVTIPKATVTFETNGGTSVEPMEVDIGGTLDTIPTTEKDPYGFAGWFDSDDHQLTTTTIILADITFYARWEDPEGVARIGNVYFDTLQDAMTWVNTNTTGEKVVLEILEDIGVTNELTTEVPAGKHVSLSIGNHTVGCKSGVPIFEVYGTLEVSDGTISADTSQGLINVKSTGKLYISGGSIIATGNRQAVYNDGGYVEISGDAYLESKAQATRGTVQNHTSGGTIKIIGGEILSTTTNAVYNEAGTLIVGQEDGVVDTVPVMTGASYGIQTKVNYQFYDGIAKGKNKGINDESKITDHEAGAVSNSSQTEGAYKLFYYEGESPKYRIDLDANGGTVSPTYIIVDPGSQVGTLPTPSNGLYTFEGWYTDNTYETSVLATTEPTGSTTYVAKWSFTATHSNFTITNDVITEYYNKIETWSGNESTFQTNMDDNFNHYSCTKCDASSNYQNCPATSGNFCDKPDGFDTGVDDVKVYESDATTLTKGNSISYTKTKNGVIYNMIPGETYYWESASDTNVHGTVTVSGKRRLIDAGGVRNVRDLGGMSVDVDGDTIIDGTLKYGRLYRGVKLSSDSDVNELTKLGINEEIDLRAASDGANDPKISNYKNRQIINYEIDYTDFPDNYPAFRNLITEVMQDIVASDDTNIYFHCKIGTDRTGTLAYFLEGLLGVPEEERLEDYELSYFYGLLNRHRFYSTQPGSSITNRFTYMHNKFKTNSQILDWYMHGSTNTVQDEQLIQSFRDKMINYN